ncbi:MAG: HAD hydrolase-like protein [Fusobacteria bacterium]|nr:HAD hydrolase-like protein [Fusobacteriota bacterium]
MNNYKLYLFDLDGTLTDSKKGLEEAIRFAAKKIKGVEIPDFMIDEFLGPPLEVSFSQFLHMTQEETCKAIECFKDYYIDKGMLYGNKVYEGIEGVLQTLKREKKLVALATSKPLNQGIKVLEHFNLKHYFDFIGAASDDGKIKEKSDVIATVVEAFPKIKVSEMLMIGDRKYDVIGAKEHSIACAGVEYGYAYPGELEAAGAKYIVKSTAHLMQLIR